MIGRLKRLARSRLLRNAGALYGVQLANQLPPLIVIPYLARVLGPQGWGIVAFAQAFAAYGTVAVGYGFEYAGTRAVARERDRAGRLAELVTGVLATQVLLASIVVLAGLAVMHALPALQESPALLYAALAFATLQGMNPLWYFTGQERLPLIALVDMIGKLIAMVSIFRFVRGPDDGWIVLASHALAALILTGAGYALLLREVRPGRPNLRLIGQTLRLGFSMMLMRVFVLMLTAGNTFLLGLFVAPQHVAFFAASDKLCRTASWLLQPINAVLLPRITFLLREHPEQARQLASLSLVSMAGIGIGLLVGLWLAAPLVVQILFGESYAAAVPIVRVMALIIPMIVVNTCLVTHFLLPHGLDRALNSVLVSGAVLNVGLALLLAPVFKGFGLAWVTVTVEGFILVGLVVALRRRGLRPFNPEILLSCCRARPSSPTRGRRAGQTVDPGG